MPSRTITALYESKSDAERAKDLLAQSDISDVNIHAQDAAAETGAKSGGFLAGLKDLFGGHEDTSTYQEGLRRGNYLLTARVADAQADTAVGLLDGTNALDLDRKQAEWLGSAPTGATTAFQPTASAANARDAGQEQVIPIVQEQLKVGKREVERGGLRVRSYMVETPVSEQITLREEHVDLDRRPVNRPISNADELLQNRTVEMTETAEEAVVAKDAVVVEEIALRKNVDERTQEINDTVRRTEVDVERTEPKGSTLSGSPSPATPPRI